MDRQHRLRRIAEIFELAMDLPPAEQARVLDRECGDDLELRREVQKLLDADAAARLTAPPSAPERLTTPGRIVVREPPGRGTLPPPSAERAPEGPYSGASEDFSSSDGSYMDDSAGGITLDTQPGRCGIAIGALVGSYRIEEQIGEGGMGVVFLARHEDLGHEAVVKVLLHRVMASSADSVKRFRREARMAAQIRHPGVVQVMHFGRHESGDLFILMERLYGEPLQRRLQREKTLAPHIAVSFTIQTARALEAVHVHGVHRDLKPGNLFLVPDPDVPGDERIKILDFGIAKPSSQPSELTGSHVFMGTPPYMAPEQCLEAADVDARADLYSLGVILFEMLCGRLPFCCTSRGEYIVAHTREEPPPVWRHAPHVSRELSDLVARLLAKRPEDRFPSARALARALEALPERRGTSASESEITTPRLVYEQAVQTANTRLAVHAVTLPAVPGSRARQGLADGSSAPPLYTEPQAPVPEAVEPTHEPACLAPSDTSPAITVAPDIIADASSQITGAPGGTPGTAPGVPGAAGVTIDTLSMATIASAERAGGAAMPWRLAPPATLRGLYRYLPAASLAILVVAISAAALHLASRPAAGADTSRPDAGLSLDAAPAAGSRMQARAGELRQSLEVLFDGASEAVQRELIRAAVDVGTPEVAWLLDRAVAEGTPAIRSDASRAMCALGWPDRAPRLRDAMRDSGGTLRVQIAVALVCLGDREGIAVLEGALHAEALLRIEAAEGLAMAGERELALPVLERELDSAVPGSPPWLHAARGLLALGHEEARSRLGGELVRPEPGRALAAADILAEAGDGEALAYLERVLADTAFTHRAEAALTLAFHARGDDMTAVAGRVLAFAEAALASQHVHDRRAAAAVAGRLAEHGGQRLAPALEALIDSDDTRDPGERAVRITARVALLALYRAMESRNPHEHQ